MLAWAIWNARNKICFEDNQARPDHYKKDCYLRQNFFNDYKKPLEKLAFSTASLFLIGNYSSNIKTFVTAKWVFQKWLLFLLKIWFVLERSVPTRGVHGLGRVDFRPSLNPTRWRRVDKRVTRNRPPASIGRDGFLLGWGSGLFEWRSGRRWSCKIIAGAVKSSLESANHRWKMSKLIRYASKSPKSAPKSLKYDGNGRIWLNLTKYGWELARSPRIWAWFGRICM